jgi:hypothetical protein
MTGTSMESLFLSLDSPGIAHLIRNARHSVCYAGPGIQMEPALAMSKVIQQLGPEMITVSLDFDERVMRMGYGDIAAIKHLRDADIVVHNVPGLRTALIIVDDIGFIFTPTALYLESEPHGRAAPNAMRLSPQQVAEALARLSPAAKAIALAQATTPEDRNRIAAIPVETGGAPITATQFAMVETRLKEAPPVKFDIARQVRVFEPYLQYMDISLTGAAIQHHRVSIPPRLLKLGGNKELEGRLRTTFELIEQDSKLSSKDIEDELNEIRKNFTPSVQGHGRVVLKAAKPLLNLRLIELKEKLKTHKQTVASELQKQLNESRKQIVEYYLPIVSANPPDGLRGQLTRAPNDEDSGFWLNSILREVFPTAHDLIDKMQLNEYYRDVTYETLNKPDFLDGVKKAFPHVNWDRAYNEFRAAGESGR